MPESPTPGFAGRGPLRRHLRLIAAQLRIGALAALEYRVGFWTDAVLGVLWSLGGVVPLLVALEHREDIVGWTGWQVALLTGFYLMISGTFAAFVAPAITEAMAHIRRGTLDYLLLRPVDSLVSCLVSAFAPWSVLEVLAGLGLVLVSALALDLRPSGAQLAMAAAVLSCGFVALYALAVLMLAVSFRALQLQNLTFLLETALEFAHWPIAVFRGPLRLIFTFVVPFAVMTSFPAQALLGALGLRELLAALATAAVLAGFARLSWRQGLRAYSSASS